MNKTPQKPVPELAQIIGVNNLWIKQEYFNESGSHKIRLMDYLIKDYLKKGKKIFVVSSSGNAAIAAAHVLNKNSDKSLKCQIFVSKNISLKKEKRLLESTNKNPNINIKKVVRPKQSAFLFSKKHSAIFLRGSQEKKAPQAYFSLAQEISKIPNLNSLFIPTSSGITALGIYQGFKKLNKKIEIHIVQTEKINSIAKEFDHNFEPKKESLSTAIVDRISLRKKEVIQMINNTSGSGWVISDLELKKAKKLLEKNTSIKLAGYDSILSLAGVIKAKKSGWPLRKTVCCLFTGL